MKCGYCGKTIKDNAKFCTYCGHNLIEIQTDEPPAPPSKGGYLSSLLTLLAIIVILGAGGAYMLQHGGQSNAVSSSDASAPSTNSYDTEGAAFDKALFGQWNCTDRAAADYSPSDYGIDVNILLEMTDKGKFTLHYSMTDTGAPALKLELNGTYSVKNNTVTFKPDLSNVSGEMSGNYFKNHGNTPSFAYTATDSTLILKYENGSDIIFTRQS